MAECERAWQIFLGIVKQWCGGFGRGECTGILSAGRGFLDGVAGFLLEASLLEILVSGSPIATHNPGLFLLQQFGASSTLSIGATGSDRAHALLPYILRQMGFNALPVEKGFYVYAGQLMCAVGQSVLVEWADGNVLLPVRDRPSPDWGVDFAMFNTLGSYAVRVAGGAGDRIVGLGTADAPDFTVHTCFYLTFVWTVR